MTSRAVSPPRCAGILPQRWREPSPDRFRPPRRRGISERHAGRAFYLKGQRPAEQIVRGLDSDFYAPLVQPQLRQQELAPKISEPRTFAEIRARSHEPTPNFFARELSPHRDPGYNDAWLKVTHAERSAYLQGRRASSRERKNMAAKIT